MQSWRIWAGEDPPTKPLICRAKDKKICFNVQAITKQGNMVVFCDQGIFHLPLEDNRTKRFCFTSEALLISSSWVKNERKISHFFYKKYINDKICHSIKV